MMIQVLVCMWNGRQCTERKAGEVGRGGEGRGGGAWRGINFVVFVFECGCNII